ncbi:MAG: hypothetical protein AB1791_05350 [Chloroflexota bacterium]
MNLPRLSFLLFLSSTIILIACSRSGTPAVTPAAFETPLSNRVEQHVETAGDGHPHEHVNPESATGQIQVTLVASELVLGLNRFAVGLLDAEGQMIHQADVHFHYFDLSNEQEPLLEVEADATRLSMPDNSVTIFAHERTFERAGPWGVEVQAVLPDGQTAVSRIGFQVVADSVTITPGEQAPAVDTPTAADVDNDLSRLTSAPQPNPAFYEISLADALQNGKPTIFLLATPAYCQTRFCGPDYEIISELQPKYADAFNFIHVEVYEGLPDPAASGWPVAPAMAAFGLTSEPWLFLIDASGVVVYRVEGFFTPEEVERQLQMFPVSD